MPTESRFEERFVVATGPRLSLSNVRGSIDVQSHDQSTVQITAVRHEEGRRDPERTEVQMRQSGDHVIVKTHYRRDPDRRRWLDGDDICPVDYVVRVPPRCDVDIRQVAGTVHVRGLTGRVQVNAVEGAVELVQVGGHTHVHAVSASVDGAHWSGQAHIRTVSGQVRVSDARLSRVQANTVSADLLIEGALDEQGRYDFNSVSGDVTLLVPAECGANSRGSTLSGHLVSDLPHQFLRRGRGGWHATVNGGGPPVRFHSVSGDLELLARKPA